MFELKGIWRVLAAQQSRPYRGAAAAGNSCSGGSSAGDLVAKLMRSLLCSSAFSVLRCCPGSNPLPSPSRTVPNAGGNSDITLNDLRGGARSARHPLAVKPQTWQEVGRSDGRGAGRTGSWDAVDVPPAAVAHASRCTFCRPQAALTSSWRPRSSAT